MEKKGLTIKAVASKYKVLSDDGITYTCVIRGRIKLDIDVFVGDYVTIDQIRGNTAIIVSVDKRKNVLTRPYVSNVDLLVIVVAPTPEPDWLLVDKLILNCYAEDVTPLLCVNKAELTDEKTIAEYVAPYKDEICCVTTSCIDGEIGLGALEKEIAGKTVCLAGQSAAGKSSIINGLLHREAMETGGLSERIMRGKNTTRHIEIFPYDGGKLVDTCGFSVMETENIKSDELRLYYGEYLKLAPMCQYHGCNHISEPNCAVKKALAENKLNADRYVRYAKIYNTLKEKENTLYD